MGLDDEFVQNETKQKQWKAFLRRAAPNNQELSLSEAVDVIRTFLYPLLQSIVDDAPLDNHWKPESGWADKSKEIKGHE